MVSSNCAIPSRLRIFYTSFTSDGENGHSFISDTMNFCLVDFDDSSLSSIVTFHYLIISNHTHFVIRRLSTKQLWNSGDFVHGNLIKIHTLHTQMWKYTLFDKFVILFSIEYHKLRIIIVMLYFCVIFLQVPFFSSFFITFIRLLTWYSYTA